MSFPMRWIAETLVRSLRDAVAQTSVTKVVVGVSGGVDSAVSLALAVRALGQAQVKAVFLPYATTATESRTDAEALVASLGVRLETVEITPQIDAYFARFPTASALRRGNKMARERMSILYDLSALHEALVLGTSNRSEILLGYGTLHGDMACAINPLGQLYKTQVWALAAYLQIPASIVQKAPSADLWAGQTDEAELGFSYAEADRLLHCMVDRQYEEEQLLRLGFSLDLLTQVRQRVERTHYKRALPQILPCIAGSGGILEGGRGEMAGHSKWKNIQHRKGRQDDKRARVFAKLARQVYVAARQGEKELASNQKLRAAVAKARAYNVPQENIERAIQKASGAAAGPAWVEIAYEGYGAGGAALLVECLTDNRNRTAAELRQVFQKNHGSMGDAGSVSWMFSRKGIIVLGQEHVQDEEVLVHTLLEDVEELELRDGVWELLLPPENLSKVEEKLEAQGIPRQYADVIMVTPHRLEISAEIAHKLEALVAALEEHDDVQAVYTNADLADSPRS